MMNMNKKTDIKMNENNAKDLTIFIIGGERFI